MLSGEALQYHETCNSELVELAISAGERQSEFIAAMALIGRYKGAELSGSTDTTLRKTRKQVTGNTL